MLDGIDGVMSSMSHNALCLTGLRTYVLREMCMYFVLLGFSLYLAFLFIWVFSLSFVFGF